MPRALAFAIALGALAAPPALAQSFFVTPSFAVTQTDDSNLFFAASDYQPDLVTRVTPGLDVERRSPTVTFIGKYSFDAERFADHPALTGVNAHRGAFDVRVRESGRVTLAATGEFVRTQSPGELNLATGLELRRAEAERVALHPSATRQIDPETTGTIDYTLTDDRVAGSLHVRTQSGGLRFERHESPRTTMTVGYDVQRFDVDGGAGSTSQVVALGLSRQLAPHTTISFRGGPRATDGQVTPELGAAFQAALRSIDVTLGYTQTRMTLVAVGVADTSTLAAATLIKAPGRLTILVTPAATRIARGDQIARVYRVAVESLYPLGRGTSLSIGYDAAFQDGNLYLTTGPTAFSRRVASIGFITRKPQGALKQ